MNFYSKIIKDNEGKEIRYYREDIHGTYEIFPEEIFFLLKQTFKENYKLFFIKCEPQHNIILSDYDLEYLSKSTIWSDFEKPTNYIYSENLKKLKYFQYLDISNLFNIFKNYKKAGCFFVIPTIKNNKYVFDFFVALDQNFDMPVFSKINFYLIKPISFDEYFENTLPINLIRDLYNLEKAFFKDNYINYSCYNYIKCFLSKKYFIIESKADYSYQYTKFNDEISVEKKFKDCLHLLKISDAKYEFFKNHILFKKLFFEKFCWQFYLFNSFLEKPFATNWEEIIGFKNLSVSKNGSFKIEGPNLYKSCVSEMIINDDNHLFSIFEEFFY